MATYTDSLGFDKGSAAYTDRGLHKVSVQEVKLDFAAIAAARTAASATALAATDVLEVLPVPAGTFVLSVGYDVTTAEGAAATIDVGDGADPNGYLDAVDLNSTGSGAMALALTEAAPNTVTGYSAGKYYAADDTIDISLDQNGIDTAVVRLWAVFIDTNGSV